MLTMHLKTWRRGIVGAWRWESKAEEQAGEELVGLGCWVCLRTNFLASVDEGGRGRHCSIFGPKMSAYWTVRMPRAVDLGSANSPQYEAVRFDQQMDVDLTSPLESSQLPVLIP
jgi:hypothetical protein